MRLPETILQELVSFYETLQSWRCLHPRMQNVALPEMSENQRKELEAPLTIEELQVAVGSFPNCKALGEYGIPIEVYKHCSD